MPCPAPLSPALFAFPPQPLICVATPPALLPPGVVVPGVQLCKQVALSSIRQRAGWKVEKVLLGHSISFLFPLSLARSWRQLRAMTHHMPQIRGLLEDSTGQGPCIQY